MSQQATPARKFLAPVLGLLTVLLIAFFAIFKFAESEAEKGLESWQDKMSLVADSRAAEVSEWLNRHLGDIERLAADASVQLYASTIIEMGATSTASENAAEAQRGYIYSLLAVEAEASGFHEQRAIDSVAANVKRSNRAGLALVSHTGQILVASAGMPMLRPEEFSFSNNRSFIKTGPKLDDKTPLVLVGAPISIAADGQTVAAWIVGARPLDRDFLQTLVQPGDDSITAETYLVLQPETDVVTPITPQRRGGRTGEARLDPAASFAANQPGGFSQRANYDGQQVLVTGRELSAPVPWILVRSVEASEAFASINERRNSLFISLSLAALCVMVALVLVWRLGVSRKLEQSYQQQSALSLRNEALNTFLRSVSDSQPSAIAALDANMTAHMVNKQMGVVAGIDSSELENRRLDTIFDAETASLLREKVESAAGGSRHTIAQLQPFTETDRLFKTEIMPLAGAGESAANVLLVMQDITDLVAANERSENLFRQLIGALTQIIDARDPWSKYHSARVADVAAAIAAEMGWDEDSQEAIHTAGQLVNLGKIFVPIDILTKQSPLSESELSLVRDSIRKGTQLIADVGLSSSIVKTLDQMREHWDGSGQPNGLEGEAIESGARILSVANAFVGIVSARAHRESLGFDKAIDILHEDAGSRYERRAVAALQNILENKQGRTLWSDFTELG